MARMIPPLLDPSTASPGEQELFWRFRNDPLCDGWIVLHSLELAEHVRQQQGEADFVVIVPELGVLCLEVKAHYEIQVQEGQWLFGRERKPGKSPFRQASEAMHSIRQWIGAARPELANLLFWSGVVFTHTSLEVKSIEWHSWQVINCRQFHSQSIGQLVLNLLRNAHRHMQQHPSGWYKQALNRPGQEECQTLAMLLRPRFELLESPRDRISRLEREMRRFTEEQFVALEHMEANPRVVFSGPAGTGKTVLALEAARRASQRGEKVLLLCFNKLLLGHLRQAGAGLNRTTIQTLHSHMLAVSKLTPPPQAPASFWQVTLPEKATEQLLEDDSEQYRYDVLIVDEAQDVLRSSYLDFLDFSLKGGLAAGRWMLFGDFEKQAIYGSNNDLTLEQFARQRGGQPARYTLRTNCRNAPRIASLAELISNLEPGYKSVLRSDDGIEPRIHNYANREEQVNWLIRALDQLYQDGFKPEEIVVLSTRRDEHSAAAQVRGGPWQGRLSSFEARQKGQVGYCTIRAFKGLEAGAVILTDIDRILDEEAQAELYVGLSRALHRLVVLLSTKANNDVRRILSGG